MCESENDCLVIFFSRAKHYRRELRMIYGIGQSLTFDGHAVVVVIRASAFAHGRSGKPVAGVDLHSGLCGLHFKHTSAARVGQSGGAAQRAGVESVQKPAVVVAFTVSQSREIGVNVAPSSLATVKSIGVPSTGAISPVGTSVLSVGSQREALSHKVWASAEPESSPLRLKYAWLVRLTIDGASADASSVSSSELLSVQRYVAVATRRAGYPSSPSPTCR